MKKLYLQIETEKIHSLEFDILWQNPNFKFVKGASLGIFDTCNCSKFDNQDGHLIFSSFNNGDREITGTHEIAEIEFEWIGPKAQVEFTTENARGKDKDNNDVDVAVQVTAFAPEPTTLITFIWR